MAATTNTALPDFADAYSFLLPQPYPEEVLVAIGETNPHLTFEQNLKGYLIVTPTASPGNAGEVELLRQVAIGTSRPPLAKFAGSPVASISHTAATISPTRW